MIKPTAIDPSVANPPRINGQVPDDYRGPLYYRVQNLTYYGGKKPLHALLSYEDRGVRRRLAKVDLSRAALRRDPVLCDARGDLASAWRTPIKARLWATPRKNWEEFDRIVSSRVRDVIEEFAPGIHYFVPVDIDDRQGGFRAYFFFCGLGWTREVVAAEASGITETTTTVGGGRIPAFPDFISSERFAYLDGSVIDGAPLFYDGRLSLVFCRELVERLGDVLPRNQAFVPMGVAQGDR